MYFETEFLDVIYNDMSDCFIHFPWVFMKYEETYKRQIYTIHI